jgi:hypothetical protein
VFADAPPYTFIAPSTGTTLSVTDAFDYGDILNVFDSAALIGTTSPSIHAVPGCHSDPVVCLADPLQSHGIFSLGAGAHSITFAQSVLSEPTFAEGSHYFRVDVAAVPEASTYALMLAGLGVLGFAARRTKQKGA